MGVIGIFATDAGLPLKRAAPLATLKTGARNGASIQPPPAEPPAERPPMALAEGAARG
jgi:hypothetical protein